MARTPKPWFRFYVETVDDEKLTRHPPAVCWLWTVLMALARKSPTPGRLLISEGTPHTADTLSTKSRVPVRQVRAAIAEFVRDSMLHLDGDTWVLTNFGPRQFESDNSTERTRKHRSNEQVRNVPTSGLGTGPPMSTENRVTDTYSSSSQTEPVAHPPPDDDDDRETEVEKALAALAETDLARRVAERGPVGNPACWLKAATESRRERHTIMLAAMRDTGQLARMTAAQIAGYLQPPVIDTRYYDAQRAACELCEGSGWVCDDDDGTAERCPKCRT